MPRQPVPKDVMVELDERHNKQCMLCMEKDISEKKYGILYQLNDVIVHYFCIVSTVNYCYILIIYILSRECKWVTMKILPVSYVITVTKLLLRLINKLYFLGNQSNIINTILYSNLEC